ncbi:MAG TPA: right-handed parallel beta-helix repeat-containing protein [Phycisphaerae bacterium]|nr:right-handed parallel beta-helix repeat-containing protein [Phycisphaerae bacterium]
MKATSQAILAAVLAAALAVAAGGAAGADYYVSNAGDDSNPGTASDKPLKTIAKAASLARAGEKILIAAGTYDERVRPANSGEPGKPITIARHGPMAKVVWTSSAPDPKRWDDKFTLNLKARSHFVVEGLTFKDCEAWVLMWDSNSCTIRDCTFDGARIYNALRINNSAYNRILNCRFLRARPYVTDDKGVVHAKHAADYIEIFRDSHHNLVERCTFGEIGHVAVSVSAFRQPKLPRFNIIRRCAFADPGWKCIGLGAAEHTLIEDCTFSGKSAVFVQLEAAKTILRRCVFHGWRNSLSDPQVDYRGVMRVATTPGDPGDPMNRFLHNRIYHNTFTDNDRTITSYGAKYPIDDNVFKNNIFFGNRMTLWLCQPDWATKNRTYFIHNVMVGAKPGEKLLDYGTGHKKYTLAEAAEKMPDLYKGNIEVDPKFADPARRDYRLKAGSPCIDAGAHLTVTTADGKGKQIPVADALYFCDGWGLIDGDLVQISGYKPFRLTKVDYEKNILHLEKAIPFRKGDGVSLPHADKAPDIGAFEAFEHGQSVQTAEPAVLPAPGS